MVDAGRLSAFADDATDPLLTRASRSFVRPFVRTFVQLRPEVAPPIGTPLPDGKSTVPPAPPVSAEDVDKLASWLSRMKRASKNVVCVTGAGLSTESGIPDYRSPNGAYSSGFKPMTHQDFMRVGDEGRSNRKKYWVRSFAGWESFSSMLPNRGHEALARLQKGGYVGWVITQNVDRLHQKGGSDAARVLELHGTTHEVRCMDCDMVYSRGEVQNMIVRTNGGRLDEDGRIGLGNLGIAATLGVMEGKRRRPQREGVFPPDNGADDADGADGADGAGDDVPRQNPDGDVEIRNTDALDFKVPFCRACTGGTLKPDVVFFGDSLPKERTDESLRLARGAGGVLVVGSSLQVMSAYRLVQQAKERGAEVFILTVGETRADALADYRVGTLAGELLPAVCEQLLGD